MSPLLAGVYYYSAIFVCSIQANTVQLRRTMVGHNCIVLVVISVPFPFVTHRGGKGRSRSPGSSWETRPSVPCFVRLLQRPRPRWLHGVPRCGGGRRWRCTQVRSRVRDRTPRIAARISGPNTQVSPIHGGHFTVCSKLTPCLFRSRSRLRRWQSSATLARFW